MSLGNLKVGGHPQSLIADRDASDVAVEASEADPNRPARTIGIGVPGGIRDQFGHNKRQIDGSVGVDEDLADASNRTSQFGVTCFRSSQMSDK